MRRRVRFIFAPGSWIVGFAFVREPSAVAPETIRRFEIVLPMISIRFERITTWMEEMGQTEQTCARCGWQRSSGGDDRFFATPSMCSRCAVETGVLFDQQSIDVTQDVIDRLPTSVTATEERILRDRLESIARRVLDEDEAVASVDQVMRSISDEARERIQSGESNLPSEIARRVFEEEQKDGLRNDDDTPPGP